MSRVPASQDWQKRRGTLGGGDAEPDLHPRKSDASSARAIADKNVALDLDALLALDGEVRGLKTRVDELRRQRNEISDGFKNAAPEERPALGASAKAIGAEIAEIEAALGEQQAALDALLLRVPEHPLGGRAGRPRRDASTPSSARKARSPASISSRTIMSLWSRRTTGPISRGSPRSRARAPIA